MKKLILSLSLLSLTSISFSQSYDKPKNTSTEQGKTEQVVVETIKPSKFNFALKLNPLSLLNSPSQWYQFNIEASIPKIPRTSLIVSFGKNLSSGINFPNEDINYVTGAISPANIHYYYNAMIIKGKKGYTNEIGLRHYIPFTKNYLPLEGLSIGVFYSIRNGSINVRETYQDPNSSHNGQILNGGQIAIEHYEKFYGAELGFQKAFGKKKQFIFNIAAGYGKKMINNRIHYYDIVGPGPSQKFENENKMAFKGNIAIGILLH